MTVMVTTAMLVWLAMAIARGTPIGRALDAALVRRPAGWLARITPGHLLLALLLGGAIALVVAVVGHEGARLLAMAAPEIVGWITMFEITAYLDALVAVTAAASGLRLRAIRDRLSPRPRRTGRRSRRPRSVSAAKAANDDDEGDAAAARAA